MSPWRKYKTNKLPAIYKCPELFERPAPVNPGVHFLLGFRFSRFKVRLPKPSSLSGIHPRFEVALLKEVPPALVVIRRTLAVLEFSQCGVRVLPAFDDLNHSGRLVGADVVANDDVGSAGFFACQRDSVGHDAYHRF